jgi:plastocyanin
MSKANFALTAIVSLVFVATGFSLATPVKADISSVFHVQMGASSPDMARMAMAFYPASITIHRMDVVVFTSDGMEPHTVTFGAPSDLYINPFDYTLPYGGTVYTGNPLNSGFMFDGSPFGSSIAVTFNIPPGTYAYRCGLHPLMQGTVTVVPDNQRLPFTDAQYAQKALGQMTSDLAKGRDSSPRS